MTSLMIHASTILATIIFGTIIILHLIKKNRSAVWLYVVQSAAVAILLLLSAVQNPSWLIFLAIFATVAVKIFVAPYFFLNLIKTNQLKFSVTTYLNLPLTLFVIAALTAITHTTFFKQLIFLDALDPSLLLTSLAAIAVSLFLIINRKGALSQMLGILSLENSIVSFAFFAGLEQNPALQLGITFNILIWIIIAAVFTSMVYKHFGTLDVSTMQKLKD